jgi:hypothetical protein
MTKQLWQILLLEDNPDERANLRQMLLLGSASPSSISLLTAKGRGNFHPQLTYV